MAGVGRIVLTLVVAEFLQMWVVATAHTTFTLRNNCPYPIWPGTLSAKGAAVLGKGGFILQPNVSTSIHGPRGWSGRFWARTGCVFNPTGSSGSCETGDCGGSLSCTGHGAPPTTLIEFTLGGERDFYDVSLVDGYNIAVGVTPSHTPTSEDNCRNVGCVFDLNEECPAELRVAGDEGQTVACKSACEAFQRHEYCCTGEHSLPSSCEPSKYSRIFKKACPLAYSYAYDDASSTFTCPTGTDYAITFCPSSATSKFAN